MATVRSGIFESPIPRNTLPSVVGDNEGGARGADPDVGSCLGERLLRHLIQLCKCVYKPSDEL